MISFRASELLLSNVVMQLPILPVLGKLRMGVAGADVPIVVEWLRFKFMPEKKFALEIWPLMW